MRPHLPSASLLGAIALLALPAPAFAQAAASDSGHDKEGAGLQHAAEEEDEAIIVQGTRLGRRLQDEPLRVEVIAGEEVEEKSLMRPGTIAMLVNEIGGVRVQVTSPALGGANVRMQGLEGRYTQLLADNLPLYGGQAASLGLLQVPPTDLSQVEVIKGSVSALGSAGNKGRGPFRPEPNIASLRVRREEHRWHCDGMGAPGEGGSGGQGWIRTSVRLHGQIYSLLPLTTRPPVHTVPCLQGGPS